jgi:hypothetical protein
MLQAGFITAFIVYFIKATTWRGMIFHGVKQKLRNLPENIRKPLIECPVCMTPWWGTAIYLTGHYTGITEFRKLTAQSVIFTVFTASGINTIFLMLNKIHDNLERHHIH